MTETATDNAPLISYRELSRRTGINANTLAWWVSQRKIPHVRLGPRHVRFRLAEIEAWLDARRVAPIDAAKHGGGR